MAEVNCFGKTENYSDKITLLNTYDTNNNGRIDSMEQMQAIADWKAGKITEDEMNVIVHVWKLGEDGISKFCRRRPPCGDYGDVDGDGWVSTKDVMYTMRHTIFLSEYPMTPDQKRRADVNGDGHITMADALIMAKYIIGQYDTFAVCAGMTPGVTPPEYLTPDDALLRIRAGERCYIKCTLPILNMLPGIPYTPGAWVPPLCAITGEP